MEIAAEKELLQSWSNKELDPLESRQFFEILQKGESRDIDMLTELPDKFLSPSHYDNQDHAVGQSKDNGDLSISTRDPEMV